MHNKVEFHYRREPASPETIARRTRIAESLGELGHIDPAAGDIDPTEIRWYAHIGDTEIPVLEFAVQPLDDGQVALSISAIVDAVSIGNTKLGSSDTEEGGGRLPDTDRRQMVIDRLTFAHNATNMPAVRPAVPRNDVPLRDVTLSQQVAQNAERVHITWAPGFSGDGWLRAIRNCIRRDDNGGQATA